MKKKVLLILGLSFTFVTPFFAQQTIDVLEARRCGTPPPEPAWDKWFNGEVDNLKADLTTNRVQAATYTIPIIVHVVHGGETVGTYPNLSYAQLLSQISILNDDYGGTGISTQNIPPVFQPTLADCGIKFCLAIKDPQGRVLAEPGVDRISYVTKGWKNPTSLDANSFMSYMDNTIKVASIWDATKYLNVWVTDCASAVGLLGYATFPAGTSLTGITSTGNSTTDGVWCLSKAYGNVGTLSPNYNLGRSATHEIGHWLGLRHIWGDGTCATDYCDDTPPANKSNAGVPIHPHNLGTCAGNTTGEMFMNFMDYSYDIAMSMFTNDQKLRMLTAMRLGTYRKVLGTHNLCAASGIAVQEELNANILLYPNPSTGTLKFSTSFSDTRNLKIEVRNLLGQTVYAQPYKTTNGSITIDLTAVAKGIYTVTISEPSGSITRKLILE